MRLTYLIMVGCVLGCGNAATTKIGTACKSDGDCNVKGQSCVAGLVSAMPTGPKISTHPRAPELGDSARPIGFDCTQSSASGLTCNKATYSVDAMGVPVLFGKACAGDADCASTGDPNAAPSCRKNLDPTSVFGPFSSPAKPLKALVQDPAAYCTGVCAADSDCPIGFACLADFDNPTADPSKKKCLKRSVCDPCSLNDHCPSDFPVCVPTADGMSHYCTKTCNIDGDCPGGATATTNNSANYMQCKLGTDVANNPNKYCFHYFGACLGAGGVCDPCRLEAECKPGTHCLYNTQSFERFCTRTCTTDTVCATPNNATCDDSSMTMSTGLCTGDTGKLYPG